MDARSVAGSSRVHWDQDDVLCSRIAGIGRAYDQQPVAEAACEVGGVPAKLAGACSAGASSVRANVSCWSLPAIILPMPSGNTQGMAGWGGSGAVGLADGWSGFEGSGAWSLPHAKSSIF